MEIFFVRLWCHVEIVAGVLFGYRANRHRMGLVVRTGYRNLFSRFNPKETGRLFRKDHLLLFQLNRCMSFSGALGENVP